MDSIRKVRSFFALIGSIGSYIFHNRVYLIKEGLVLIITLVRPFLGPEGCCRYPVTCTAFAKQQLRQKPFLAAVYAIFLRLISCNPFTKI